MIECIQYQVVIPSNPLRTLCRVLLSMSPLFWWHNIEEAFYITKNDPPTFLYLSCQNLLSITQSVTLHPTRDLLIPLSRWISIADNFGTWKWLGLCYFFTLKRLWRSHGSVYVGEGGATLSQRGNAPKEGVSLLVSSHMQVCLSKKLLLLRSLFNELFTNGWRTCTLISDEGKHMESFYFSFLSKNRGFEVFSTFFLLFKLLSYALETSDNIREDITRWVVISTLLRPTCIVRAQSHLIHGNGVFGRWRSGGGVRIEVVLPKENKWTENK